MKFWIPGPQRAYGTTPRGFQGEIQVVRASDYDLVAHANKVQAEEIHALRKALAQSTILNGSDFVLAYPGCPDCWRVKPEDMPARAADQQPAPQPDARLAEAERLILRMSGEGFQRAKFYVDKYDLTGERAADSASAVQPERCCLDYPRCDCNSPPEPDDDWHCSQYPGCECFAGCREKALEAAP